MLWRDCIFDLYGTLVDIRTDERSPRLWEAMAGWYGARGADYAPRALEDGYFRLVRQLEREAAEADRDIPGACPEIRLEQVFLRLFQEKGVPAGPDIAAAAGERFRRCSLERLCLYEGAKELLEALRANGQRVWLLSNAQRIFTMPELDYLGLTPYFDGICLSSDYGVKKPDPRFFRRLLAERAIRPEEAVMVGNDGACDILGARAVGLATVYVRSEISPREPLPPADYALDRMDLAWVREILTRR